MRRKLGCVSLENEGGRRTGHISTIGICMIRSESEVQLICIELHLSGAGLRVSDIRDGRIHGWHFGRCFSDSLSTLRSHSS